MPVKPATREFSETVRARAEMDPVFRESLISEATSLLKNGEVEAARLIFCNGLDASLARGLDDARAGRTTLAEDVLRRLLARYQGYSPDAANDYRDSSSPDVD